MKIGDWVTNSEGFLFRVTEENIYACNDFALWQPKEGEWVVSPIGTDNFQCFKWFDGCKDKLAEPFIGELPSFIRR